MFELFKKYENTEENREGLDWHTACAVFVDDEMEGTYLVEGYYVWDEATGKWIHWLYPEIIGWFEGAHVVYFVPMDTDKEL